MAARRFWRWRDAAAVAGGSLQIGVGNPLPVFSAHETLNDPAQRRTELVFKLRQLVFNDIRVLADNIEPMEIAL